MVFLGLILIPLIVLAVAYKLSNGGITVKESLVQIAASAIIAGASIAIIYHVNTTDREIQNARVANKAREVVTCSHDYCCRTTTYTYSCGSGKHHRTCTGTRCAQYCKRHPFDVDWAVYTTKKERMEISRLSSQGLEEPPRWAVVRLGEPTASAHSYENYIKAAPGTLFRRDIDETKYQIPAYPDNVFDYYRLHRFVSDGAHLEETVDQWNTALAELNSDMGAAKDVNVVLVVVSGKPREYFYALEAAWVGGKINDVVVVINTVKGTNHVEWVEVTGWFKDQIFKVQLRDDLMMVPDLQIQLVTAAIAKNVLEHFEHRSMDDFAYLKASIAPSMTEWIISILIGTIVAIGLALLFHHHDPFNEQWGNHRRW